jgi:hypothetical protein
MDLDGIVDAESAGAQAASAPHAAPDTRRPLLAFAALLCLTLVTVAISALHLLPVLTSPGGLANR